MIVRGLFVQYFDQDRGAEMLRKVCATSIDADVIAKYVVLAASFCILRYMESISGNSIAPHSMRLIASTDASCRLFIDRRTAVNLELISSVRNGKQKESLFGVLNYTRTVVGARMLRC